MMKKLKVKTMMAYLYALACLFLPWQAHANDNPPSLELLEFLAEWESDDGEWIDPLQMQTLNPDNSEEQLQEAQTND